MTLPFVLILGILFVSWSFLTVLGNERQRRVQERERAAARRAPEASVGR